MAKDNGNEIELTELKKIGLNLSNETVKQFIWISSGLSIFILTAIPSLFNILDNYDNNYYKLLLLLPLSSLTLFVLSIYHSTKFFQSVLARVVAHKDGDLMSDVVKKDMGNLVLLFRWGLGMLILSLIVIYSTLSFSEHKSFKKDYMLYSNDSTRIEIHNDTLIYHSLGDTLIYIK